MAFQMSFRKRKLSQNTDTSPKLSAWLDYSNGRYIFTSFGWTEPLKLCTVSAFEIVFFLPMVIFSTIVSDLFGKGVCLYDVVKIDQSLAVGPSRDRNQVYVRGIIIQVIMWLLKTIGFITVRKPGSTVSWIGNLSNSKTCKSCGRAECSFIGSCKTQEKGL